MARVFAAAAGDVKMTIGGVDGPVSSLGTEGNALGLDQVKVLMPAYRQVTDDSS